MGDDERRRHLRIFYNTSITFVLSTGIEVVGRTEDISLGGLKFSAGVMLPVGQRLSAELRFPNGRAYTIAGTICAVKKNNPYVHHMTFSDQTIAVLKQGILSNE